MKINTNISNLSSNYYLKQAQQLTSVAMERLSSGLKINSAKDDAAGLIISERMTTMINGDNRSITNVRDGLSMIQVAESALASIENQFQRMRELLLQSKNGTYSEIDLKNIEQEVKQIQNSINSIASSTYFNGINLLQRDIKPDVFSEVIHTITNIGTVAKNNGTKTHTITIPPRDPDIAKSVLDVTIFNTQYEVDFKNIQTVNFYSDAGSIGPFSQTQYFNTGKTIQSASIRVFADGDLEGPNEFLDTYINGTHLGRWSPGQYASWEHVGTFDITALVAGGENIEIRTTAGNLGGDGTDGGRARYEISVAFDDGTIYTETKALTTQLINPNGTVVAQRTATGDAEHYRLTDVQPGNWRVRVINPYAYANSEDVTIEVKYNTTSESDGLVRLHTGDEYDNFEMIKLTDTESIVNLTTGNDVATEAAINGIDAALEEVVKERARYGVLMNQLNFKLQNLEASSKDMVQARSRIQDANMAEETSQLTRQEILTQTALSAMQKSFATPQSLLKLFQ